MEPQGARADHRVATRRDRRHREREAFDARPAGDRPRPACDDAEAPHRLEPAGVRLAERPGNSAHAYYPGDAYVDVIGEDLYDIRGHGATWAAAEALYKAHPSKPFAFAEWGVWGFDDPQFVRDMAKFVRQHRRVEFIAYYSGRPGSVFDLATKPRSRAAYRALITPLGMLP